MKPLLIRNVLSLRKTKQNGKKDCELKMRILTGGPFIYYLGNVLEPKTQDVQEL